jgi:hypothetical protein
MSRVAHLITVATLGALITLLPGGAIADPTPEQDLSIHFKLSKADFAADGKTFARHDLEGDFEIAAGKTAKACMNQISRGYFTVCLYGEDAQAILKAITPELGRHKIWPGSYITIETNTGAPKTRIELPLPKQ